MLWNNQNLIETLKEGGVAVMPTDTIYGLVGRALNKETVKRVYDIKKRAPAKPCIILISSIEELKNFSIDLSAQQLNALNKYWPGSVSIILDALAFRIPAKESLRMLLKEVGPLIAPSANPEGLPPARNIGEAKQYFTDTVDYYLDGGEIFGRPSKIIKLHKDGTETILRG